MQYHSEAEHPLIQKWGRCAHSKTHRALPPAHQTSNAAPLHSLKCHPSPQLRAAPAASSSPQAHRHTRNICADSPIAPIRMSKAYADERV